jgi:ketosteroid isomerase-like protein
VADRDLEAELSDLERAWMAAVRSRDMPFLEALLGDEFTLTTARPGFEVRSRREWLEVTRSEYSIEEFEFEEVAVRVHGDAALVRSRFRQTGSINGQDRTTTYLMTDVFVRGGDHGWLAVVRHVSPLEGPPRRGLSGQPLA